MWTIKNAEGLSREALECLATNPDEGVRLAAAAELNRRDDAAIHEARAAIIEVSG